MTDDAVRYGTRHPTDQGATVPGLRAVISSLERRLAAVPDTPAGARRAVQLASRLTVERRRLAALQERP